MNYKYASVVRLTMDDPTNDHMNEGDVLLVAGKNEDGYSYEVLDREKEGSTTVKGEVVGRFEAPYNMSESDIKAWAADQPEVHDTAEAVA